MKKYFRSIISYTAFRYNHDDMKFSIFIIYIVLFLLSFASVKAQTKYSISACNLSQKQNFVGDRFKLTVPKKVKVKYIQDVDYLQYFIYFGKKKNHIYFSGIFGPNASEGIIPKEWLADSKEVSERRWTFGDYEGADAKGKLANGNLWRYFGAGGEEITYHDVSPEAAVYFDNIIDTVCYQPR